MSPLCPVYVNRHRHAAILERFVVPLGNAQDHGPPRGAGVEFGGADEVADILNEDAVQGRKVQFLEGGRDHRRIQVAGAARTKPGRLPFRFITVSPIATGFTDTNSLPP